MRILLIHKSTRMGKQIYTNVWRGLTILVLIAVLGAPFFAFAHEGEVHEEESALEEIAQTPNLALAREQAFSTNNLRVAGIAAILIAAFVVVAMFAPRPSPEPLKRILFWSIVIVVLSATIYLAGSTIYLNVTSITGGPVHWHADFKIVACGEELHLAQARGLANRVGTATFHHHDDNRIHVEGVVTSLREVTLENFFGTIGGRLSTKSFSVPTHDGLATYMNGEACPDGTRGTMQVFVWYMIDEQTGLAGQRKLQDPQGYVPAPYSQIPPGDCVLVEFGPEKERTDEMCTFWQLTVQKGDITIAP